MRHFLFMLLAFLLAAQPVFAAGKVGSYPAATSLDGTEQLTVKQGSATKRATALEIGQTVLDDNSTGTDKTLPASQIIARNPVIMAQYPPYNMNCDGNDATDEADEMEAAIAAADALGGSTIVVKNLGGGDCSWSNVDASGTTGVHIRFEGMPGIKNLNTDTGELLDISGTTDFVMSGLVAINGNKSAVPTGQMIYLNNTVRPQLSGLRIVDMPGNNGGIYLTGTTTGARVCDIYSLDSEGNAIGLIGSNASGNEICDSWLQNNGGFGVFVNSDYNYFHGLKTTSSERELVGLTSGADFNRIVAVHAEGTGDNGVSITGDFNILEASVLLGNDLAGFALYGSNNGAYNNTSYNNGQAGGTNAGALIEPNFGGLGANNLLANNNLGDNQGSPTQSHCLRAYSASYDTWLTATSYDASQYVSYGDNIYKTTAGGTSGATPPTHTSGTVSDGGVSWLYVRNGLSGAFKGNIIGPNVCSGFGTAEAFVSDNFGNSIRTKANTYYGDGGGSSTFNLKSDPTTGTSAFRACDAHSTCPGGFEYQQSSNKWTLTANNVANVTADSISMNLSRGLVLTRASSAASPTLAANNLLMAITSTSSARNPLMPASGRTTGMLYGLIDESGAAGTNSITWGGNGSNIGNATDYLIDRNSGAALSYFDGSQWRILADYKGEPLTPLSVYASGTAYSLTASSAAVDFGTTDPALTINKKGIWVITARARLDYNGASFAANRTATMKLRRTNNTATDLTNCSAVSTTDVTTTKTETFIDQTWTCIYNTINTNDSIAMYGDVSVAPSPGSLDVSAASIVAVRQE